MNKKPTADALEIACEIIRREDARMASKCKRKLLSVEIDPETYIAKEILFLEELVHRLIQQVSHLEDQLKQHQKEKGKDS